MISNERTSHPTSSQQALPEATIIGAGLTGSLLGLYLARHGFKLNVFEKRPDMRKVNISAGRSINLAISTRGLKGLEKVGLTEKILQQSIPMYGRMIHLASGDIRFQPYGKEDQEAIRSISRADLNKILLSELEQYPDVALHFEHKLQKVEEEKFLTLSLEDESEKEIRKIKKINSSLTFASDGSASVLREFIVPENQINHQYESHSYKELYIPAAADGSFQMEKNALHIWPRGSFMLIALPNRDGSFTCTLFLETEGNSGTSGESFASLSDEKKVLSFFQHYFPDVLPLIPDLVQDFFHNPTGHLYTIKCAPWVYKDQALLIGDAAHAIVPFYGQGMNCCFEDCRILDECLTEYLASTASSSSSSSSSEKINFSSIFEKFQKLRKENTDAIADMAQANFIEMRDLTGNAQFLKRKQIEQIFMQKAPDIYLSQYYLVTFTNQPYAYALKVGKFQEEFLKKVCEEISDGDLLNGQINDQKIEKYLEEYKRLCPKLNG